MNSTQKFTAKADIYTKSRPDYAESFIDTLYADYGFNENTIIADIGSGTGKFSRQLLKRNSTVFCIEPNTDMRSVAKKELDIYRNFISIDATAENTTLNNKSVDFITTAQAFHWFDKKAFKKECQRILKPDGMIFLVWNSRNNDSPVNRALFEINKKFCPDFKGFSGGISRDDDTIKVFFDGKYKFLSFDNHLFYDREAFIGRSLSSSYSLKSEDENYEAYLCELNKLFDEFSSANTVKTENYTVAYIGTV